MSVLSARKLTKNKRVKFVFKNKQNWNEQPEWSLAWHRKLSFWRTEWKKWWGKTSCCWNEEYNCPTGGWYILVPCEHSRFCFCFMLLVLAVWNFVIFDPLAEIIKFTSCFYRVDPTRGWNQVRLVLNEHSRYISVLAVWKFYARYPVRALVLSSDSVANFGNKVDLALTERVMSPCVGTKAALDTSLPFSQKELCCLSFVAYQGQDAGEGHMLAAGACLYRQVLLFQIPVELFLMLFGVGGKSPKIRRKRSLTVCDFDVQVDISLKWQKHKVQPNHPNENSFCGNAHINRNIRTHRGARGYNVVLLFSKSLCPPARENDDEQKSHRHADTCNQFALNLISCRWKTAFPHWFMLLWDVHACRLAVLRNICVRVCMRALVSGINWEGGVIFCVLVVEQYEPKKYSTYQRVWNDLLRHFVLTCWKSSSQSMARPISEHVQLSHVVKWIYIVLILFLRSFKQWFIASSCCVLVEIFHGCIPFASRALATWRCCCEVERIARMATPRKTSWSHPDLAPPRNLWRNLTAAKVSEFFQRRYLSMFGPENVPSYFSSDMFHHLHILPLSFSRQISGEPWWCAIRTCQSKILICSGNGRACRTEDLFSTEIRMQWTNWPRILLLQVNPWRNPFHFWTVKISKCGGNREWQSPPSESGPEQSPSASVLDLSIAMHEGFSGRYWFSTRDFSWTMIEQAHCRSSVYDVLTSAAVYEVNVSSLVYPTCNDEGHALKIACVHKMYTETADAMAARASIYFQLQDHRKHNKLSLSTRLMTILYSQFQNQILFLFANLRPMHAGAPKRWLHTVVPIARFEFLCV